jgi:zinc protease
MLAFLRSCLLRSITAYISVPGWRESAIDQARSTEAEAVSEASASPGGVVRLDLAKLLHDGDRRWSSPTPTDIAALRLQDVKSLIEPQLASAPIEVVVVGSKLIPQCKRSPPPSVRYRAGRKRRRLRRRP